MHHIALFTAPFQVFINKLLRYLACSSLFECLYLGVCAPPARHPSAQEASPAFTWPKHNLFSLPATALRFGNKVHYPMVATSWSLLCTGSNFLLFLWKQVIVRVVTNGSTSTSTRQIPYLRMHITRAASINSIKLELYLPTTHCVVCFERQDCETIKTVEVITTFGNAFRAISKKCQGFNCCPIHHN